MIAIIIITFAGVIIQAKKDSRKIKDAINLHKSNKKHNANCI